LRSQGLYGKIDWLTVIIYAVIVIAGWLNIYAAVYDESAQTTLFSISTNAGRQFIFIIISFVVVGFIMIMDFRVLDTFSLIIYFLTMFLLVLVLFLARDINGASSWLEIGSFRFQPSELAKIGTALALAKLISMPSFKISEPIELVKAFLIILLPIALVILQRDMGTSLVFFALIFVLYREGMNPWPIVLGMVVITIFTLTILVEKIFLIGGAVVLFLLVLWVLKKTAKNILLLLAGLFVVIGSVFSVDYALNDVLSAYQRDRIQIVFNPNADPLGRGWNITQSKIAIGSGGFSGKGYLKGTQTKFDFVPEQSTDFIFCTIGEEHGFQGSALLIALFLFFMIRIINIAERQKWRFARTYGYAVACILFTHFAINIGMTLGLFPVIGIPLPFFSYGGSSLLSFSILLFILIKLDAHRDQLLERGVS